MKKRGQEQRFLTDELRNTAINEELRAEYRKQVGHADTICMSESNYTKWLELKLQKISS